MPPALAASARAALRRVVEDEWRREHLQALISHFSEGAARRGLVLMPSDSPIQPMIIGDSRATLELAERLRQQGFLVVAMRPPTVREGTSRLRITLTVGAQRAPTRCASRCHSCGQYPCLTVSKYTHAARDPSSCCCTAGAMHSGIWGGLVDVLASEYRVSLVDLPGHGVNRQCSLDPRPA